MLVSSFSCISLVVLIANITHMNTGWYAGQRNSIALNDAHVSLFSVILA